ncbi:MAG: metallophosphoesterase [Candidatus Nanoarchaeia archaeon]
MQIHENIEIIGLSLYLKDSGTLVFSDLHIGYEGEMHKKGFLVPKVQFTKIMQHLEMIFGVMEKNKWHVNTIIMNGDVKHGFGKISEQEWREILRLTDFLLTKCKDIIVVEGNHDPVLKPVAAKRDVKLVKEHQINDVLILHGDEEPDLDVYEVRPNILIMGHEHPALLLTEGAKRERYKCFMKGEYDGATLLCLPSFNPLTQGTDMLREKTLSPLLDRDLGRFEAWIVADKTYYFGKLSELDQ